jgi:hypothetical protein
MAVLLKEPLKRGRVTAREVMDFWDANAPPWRPSRETILYCRDVQSGREGPMLRSDGKGGGLPGARLPQRKMLPMRASNRFGAKRAFLHRLAAGESVRAGEDADNAEQFINAALEQTYDNEAVAGKAVEDSEWGLIVQPSPSYYEAAPDWLDSVLEPKRYDDDLTAYLAERPPWVCRLVSATDCAPLLVRGRGKYRWRVEGLAVRTLHRREDLLRRGYRWKGDDNPLLVPTGYDAAYSYGAAGGVYLYELWTYLDDHPVVAYCVAGLEAAADQRAATQIDLFEEYGLAQLPVGYFWGLHTESDDPARRGVPLLSPLASMLSESERLLTAITTDAWENSFTGHTVPIDKDTPPAAYMEGDQLRVFRKPELNEILTMPGEPTPFRQAQVGRDAYQVLQALLGQVQQQTASEALAGGPGGESGHQLSVADELERLANRQIAEGVRQSIEFAGERIAELCCTLARGRWKATGGKKFDVPLYVNVEVEPTADGTAGRMRADVLEFDERWFGRTYQMHARYPEEGNLAETSLEADLADRGYATVDDVLAKRGKTSTTLEKARILSDRIDKTPEGLQARLAMAYRVRGETEKARAIELQLEAKLTPDGHPATAVAPELANVPQGQGQAPQQGGPMPGVQPTDVAGAVRGGIVAGQMGTASRIADARARLGVQAGPPNGSAA